MAELDSPFPHLIILFGDYLNLSHIREPDCPYEEEEDDCGAGSNGQVSTAV